MTGFAEAHGYGADPAGDAARRAEQGVVELPDGTKVAGVPPSALPAVAAHLTGSRLLPAGPRGPSADLVIVDDAAVEVLDPADPHATTRTEYPWGIAVVCACGQWECVVTGPSSADWARRDHERHRTLAG